MYFCRWWWCWCSTLLLDFLHCSFSTNIVQNYFLQDQQKLPKCVSCCGDHWRKRFPRWMEHHSFLMCKVAIFWLFVNDKIISLRKHFLFQLFLIKGHWPCQYHYSCLSFIPVNNALDLSNNPVNYHRIEILIFSWRLRLHKNLKDKRSLGISNPNLTLISTSYPCY